MWYQGQLVLSVATRSQSGSVVTHPEQFRTVLPAAAARRTHVPVGHQVLAPTVTQRSLADYDWLCGVGVQEGALSEPAKHAEVAS
jgi:hypothetical protein